MALTSWRASLAACHPSCGELRNENTPHDHGTSCRPRIQSTLHVFLVFCALDCGCLRPKALLYNEVIQRGTSKSHGDIQSTPGVVRALCACFGAACAQARKLGQPNLTPVAQPKQLVAAPRQTHECASGVVILTY